MSTATIKKCNVCGKFPSRFSCHVCHAEICKPCLRWATLYTHVVHASVSLEEELWPPLAETIEADVCLICKRCYDRYGLTVHQHRFDYGRGPSTPLLDGVEKKPAQGKVHDWSAMPGFERQTTQGTLPPNPRFYNVWDVADVRFEKKPKKKARRGKGKIAVDRLLQLAMEDDDG